MLQKLKLKNTNESVLLDAKTYEFLTTDPHLVEINFIENLRKHSSGCVVYQRTFKKAGGGYATETIYLHKLIAETFLSDQKSSEKNLSGTINGNKLDCRIENIVWRTRANASRQRKAGNISGYTGVYQEGKKFRAVITSNSKSIHIGMYETAEEAALAFNRKSKELFGDEGKLNIIKKTEDTQ